MTQADLGDAVGLSHDAISKIERGLRRVRPPERKAIAAALMLDLASFDDLWRADKIARTVGGDGIPVINLAPAGTVTDYAEYGVDSGQGFMYVERGSIEDELAFAVQIVGDSMEPSLFQGDTLILSPMTVPKPRAELVRGCVVFVRFAEESPLDGCMIARWHPGEDGTVTLAKDNPRYPPTVARPVDIQQLSVAVERRSKRGL